MNFLETIFHRLSEQTDRAVLQEMRDGLIVSATGIQLLAQVRNIRAFLKGTGVKKADRCALLAPKSPRSIFRRCSKMRSTRSG